MGTESAGHTSCGIQVQEGRAPRPTPRSIYPWGFLLSMVVWSLLLCLLASPWYRQAFPASAEGSLSSPDSVAYILAVAAVLFLVESLCSPVFGYLRHLRSAEDVVTYVHRLQSYAPVVQFGCSCYHDETRQRFITEQYVDSEGHSATRQRVEFYTERVVTHTETHDFAYARWEDCSPTLTPTIYRYEYICLDFDFDCKPGDSATETRYDEEKEQFIARNRPRDSGFSFWEKCSLRDFTPRMLSIVDASKRSRLMHWAIYLLATLLILSWPYRVWFDRQTVHGDFVFRKRVFL